MKLNTSKLSAAVCAMVMCISGAGAVSADNINVSSIINTVSSVSAASIAKPALNSDYKSTKNTASVSWKSVKGVQGYEVWYYLENTDKWYKAGTTSKCSYTIKGLGSGLRYGYKIRAYKSSGSKKTYGGWSKTNYFATIPTDVKITAVNRDSDAVRVTWKSQKCSKYDLTIYQGSKKIQSVSVSNKNIDYTFRGLKRDTKYTVKIRAKKYGGGRYVNGSYVSTSTTTKHIKAPTNVKLTAKTGSVKLEWGDSSKADKYRIYRYNDSTKKWEQLAETTDKYYYDMKLSANKTYKYRVYSYKTEKGKTYEALTRDKSCTTLKKPYTATKSRTKDVWVGDSRTVHLRRYEDIETIAKSGEGYKYLTENMDKICALKNANIILNLGVNDLKNLDKYVEAYNKIYDKTKGSCTVYFMTINPCTGEKYGYREEIITNFNNTMKQKLNKGIKIIDSCEYLRSTGYDSYDGLHYSPDTCSKIYYYVCQTIHGTLKK